MITALCGAIAAILAILGIIVPDNVTKSSPIFWLLLAVVALGIGLAFLAMGWHNARR